MPRISPSLAALSTPRGLGPVAALAMLHTLAACGARDGDGAGDDNADASAATTAGQDGGDGDVSGGDGDGGDSGDGDGDGDGGPLYDCDSTPVVAPPVPDNLEFQTAWGDPNTMEVRTQGMWAVWWYPEFEHEADAAWLLDHLDRVRCFSLTQLGMRDPPNPGAGVYYNVYIHHGDQDAFPNQWGNGQGTDGFGQPFLTLPNGAHLDEGNVDHEGFHVFQYSADSPGFAYQGDSQWYIESTAQWYAAWRRPTAEDAFIEAGAIDGNPHVALWHSFSNEAPGDPTDWMFQVRQYGMHTYLYYLTEVAGLSRDLITRGFFGMVDASPQEFHYQEYGAATLRATFADWAAHNTADFDYLTPAQVARARLEVEWVGDPDNIRPHIATYVDAGTGGQAVRPPAGQTPRGWSYNVVKIENSTAATYSFSIQGDAVGSEGAAAYFDGRVVAMGPSGASYTDVVMASNLAGSVEVSVDAAVTEVYLVVAAMPEHFGGNQTYDFEFTIDRQP